MEEVIIDNNKRAFCPHCQSRQSEPENRWCYGSPIRTCPKCHGEFLDKRYTELAVSGIPEKQLSVKRDLIFILIGLGFIAVGFLLSIIRGGWNIKSSVISIDGGFMALCFIVDVISILTGSKLKKLEKLKGQSEERLRNYEYAEKLVNLGYNVPNEYRR